MEGIGLVVLLQQLPALAPHAVQHTGLQVPARQGFQHPTPADELLEFPVEGLLVQGSLLHQLLPVRQGAARLGHRLGQLLIPGAGLPHCQSLQHRRVVALVAHGRIVQHHAAADGLQGGEKANDEPVAHLGGHRLRQPELGIAALPRFQPVPVQQHRFAQQFRRAVIQMNLRAAEDHPLGVFQRLQPYIQHQGRTHGPGTHHGIAPLDLRLFQARQVDGHPLSGVGCLHVLAVDLEVAHLGGKARGHQLRSLSLGDTALNESTGDHGAKALHREHPVHRQAEGHPCALLRRLLHQKAQVLSQLVDALAGIGRAGHNGLALQEGALDLLRHVLLHHLQPLRVHHVGLGDDHQAVLDAQQGQNAQVLHGLGHEALVRRYHQHGKVDAAGTGQHVFDELLMAGHVHDARPGAVGEVQMGKAQLDGDAPLLLLHQPVGVDARQSLHQQRFAVVHMARSSDDHIFHSAHSVTAAAMAAKSS